MHSRPSARASLSLLPLVGLAILSACGGETDDFEGPDPPGATQLRVILRDGEWPQNEPEEVQQAPPTLKGSRPWSMDRGGELIPIEGKDGEAQEDGVRIDPGAGTVLVKIPLPLGADGKSPERRNIDLLRMKVIVPRFARFSAFVAFGKPDATRTAVVELARKKTVTTVELPFVSEGASGRSFDELTLLVQGAEAPVDILEAEIVTLSNASRLPDPTARPVRYVAIGSESRPAHGVLPGLALVSTLPPMSNGRVSFGAALPPAFGALKGEKIKASIVLEGETLLEESFSLQSTWGDFDLEAKSISGREGAELRLETAFEHGVICSTPIAHGSKKKSPSSVLLVTSDTHRADYVGYAKGDPRVQTPVIDELSARGLTFHQARSVSSITNPSHTSILTGLSPRDSGVQGNLTLLSDRATSIAEEFRDAGYRTFAVASARHLSPGRSGLGQGFERFDSPQFSLSRDGKTAVEATQRMLDSAKGEDVFVWVHFFDAHGPYRDHTEYTDLYYDRSGPDPFSEKFAELPEEQRLPWERRLRDARFALALYSGEVTYVDNLLGSLFSKAPRLKDGWIALTADHGESHGEQNMWWNHKGLYPSTLNVPLLLAGPGIEAGESFQAVANTSAAKTLLALAGIEGAEAFPGERLDLVDVSSVGEGESRSVLASPHYVIGPDGNSAGVFIDHWYYLLHMSRKKWGNPQRPSRHAAELYDLRTDPGCTENVLMQNRVQAAKLRRHLVDFLNDLPEDGVLASEEMIGGSAQADMVALGYAAETSGKREEAIIDRNCECAFCASDRKLLED